MSEKYRPRLEDWIKLDFVDGMIGCCPVFKYKKDARKHAGKDGQVIKIEFDQAAAKQ